MSLLHRSSPVEVPARPRRSELVGKAMITMVAVAAPVGAVAADWNPTHLYNPTWSPHAKFHDAQTIAVAAELAAVSIWQLWGGRGLTPSRLRWAVLTAAMYWVSQCLAVLFPNTALADGQDEHTMIIGVPVNQVTAQAFVLLPVLAAGRHLASSTTRAPRASTEQESS
jgi:ABC-type xylose transport system permease subunit